MCVCVETERVSKFIHSAPVHQGGTDEKTLEWDTMRPQTLNKHSNEAVHK